MKTVRKHKNSMNHIFRLLNFNMNLPVCHKKVQVGKDQEKITKTCLQVRKQRH